MIRQHPFVMYILELQYDNAALNEQGVFSLSGSHETPGRWNVIEKSHAPLQEELLRLVALSCSGCTAFLNRLDFDLKSLVETRKKNLHLELCWRSHIPQNRTVFASGPVKSAVAITKKGAPRRLGREKARLLPDKYPYLKLSKWCPPSRHTVFAYGSGINLSNADHDFDFHDPFFQLKRIHSLFDSRAGLTHAPSFLASLHYRAVRCRRYMPASILGDLQRFFAACFGLQTSAWMQKDADIAALWEQVPAHLKLPLLPVMDAARHLHDALPSQPNPLHFPGVMILDSPEKYCPQDYFPDWIKLLEQVFPAMQFIVALSPLAYQNFYKNFSWGTLPQFKDYHQHYPPRTTPSAPSSPLSPGTMLMVDVDGRLPNLALMKLARHYREKGYPVQLSRKEACVPGAEAVFASCVFNLDSSRRRFFKMQSFYGQKFCGGGSGVDLHMRLPADIEAKDPDFDLYPELQERALGFLTRGCPFKCPFCIVPVKEGRPRQVSDVKSLVQGRKKLILLDDNILAHPECEKLLQELAARKIAVNFNQTLDLSLVDESRAGLLRRIQACNVNFKRSVYHFSLNDDSNLQALRRKYELLAFNSKNNVEFICMYGYNTTLAQDLERFKFLRSLPGAYVFVQQYQPILNGPPPQMENYFDGQADRYIDELIRICFPQCMKSMEKYYRWLSKRYVEAFGTLHMGLVDTIFRYNNRFNRGKYIASLAGTRKII